MDEGPMEGGPMEGGPMEGVGWRGGRMEGLRWRGPSGTFCSVSTFGTMTSTLSWYWILSDSSMMSQPETAMPSLRVQGRGLHLHAGASYVLAERHVELPAFARLIAASPPRVVVGRRLVQKRARRWGGARPCRPRAQARLSAPRLCAPFGL